MLETFNLTNKEGTLSDKHQVIHATRGAVRVIFVPSKKGKPKISQKIKAGECVTVPCEGKTRITLLGKTGSASSYTLEEWKSLLKRDCYKNLRFILENTFYSSMVGEIKLRKNIFGAETGIKLAEVRDYPLWMSLDEQRRKKVIGLDSIELRLYTSEEAARGYWHGKAIFSVKISFKVTKKDTAFIVSMLPENIQFSSKYSEGVSTFIHAVKSEVELFQHIAETIHQ